jgi:hypothetical protein
MRALCKTRFLRAYNGVNGVIRMALSCSLIKRKREKREKKAIRNNEFSPMEKYVKE